ncbi:MAG: hypothetical protein ACI30J_09135 [Paludibacteraceae bacterium]
MDTKLEHILQKVLLLCAQNAEFANALREKLDGTIIANHPNRCNVVPVEQENFASIMRLQHENCRKKARKYYQKIKNPQLRKDLVNDYAQMLWYKSIFDIGKYFVYVNYQVENMLNYYLTLSDFHNKVAAQPRLYNTKLEFSKDYTVSIDVYSYAFDRYNGNAPLPPSKMKSLWAKILFWAVDTNQLDMLQQQKNNFNAIITIRNEESHANYMSKSSTKYWQNQEDGLGIAFIEAIIKQIRNTIINLESPK